MLQVLKLHKSLEKNYFGVHAISPIVGLVAFTSRFLNTNVKITENQKQAANTILTIESKIYHLHFNRKFILGKFYLLRF